MPRTYINNHDRIEIPLVKLAAVSVVTIFLAVNASAYEVFTVNGTSEPFSTGSYSVNTLGVDNVGDRALNLSGEVSGLSDVDDPVDVWFEWREAGDASWQIKDAGTVNGSQSFSSVLTGLSPGTDYEFVAYSEHYNGSINSQTTNTYEVSTSTDVDPGVNWLRLRGELSNVSQFTTDINDDIQLQFEYRQQGSSTWNTVNAAQRDINGFYEERVSGLQEDTVYEFRAVSEDGVLGSTGSKKTINFRSESGGSKSFTTTNYDVSTNKASDVGDRALNLSGEVSGLSELDDPVNVGFNYTVEGQNNWNQWGAGTVSGSKNFSAVVTGLDVNTTYEFHAYSEDSSGGIKTETTGTYNVFTESTDADVGVDWIELEGSVSGISSFTNQINDNIQFQFDYRQQGDSTWNTVSAGTRTSDGTFQERVSGLQQDTVYEFRANSEDNVNQGSIESKKTINFRTESGGLESFSTPSYSITTSGTDGVGDRSINFTGQASSLSNLDEPLDVSFYYRESGSSSWQQANAGSIEGSETFSKAVTGLNPGTVYEFKASSQHYNGSIDSATTETYDITTEGVEVGTGWLLMKGGLSNVSQFTTDINDQIQLQFQYRKPGNTWNTVNADTRSIDGFYEKRVEGLEQGAEYEFRAISEDGYSGGVQSAYTLELFTESGGVISFATGADFNVSIDSINTPVLEGDEVQVDTTIENTGASGNGTISLNISGLGSDSVNVDLNSGQIANKKLNVSTSTGDFGEYVAEVSSNSDSDTRLFNVSKLRPPVNPKPVSGTEPIGLDWDLSAVSNSSFDTGLNFYVVNNSGSDIPLGGNISSQGERINVSLEDNGLEPGTEYEWYANSSYLGHKAQSQIWNFTTVERPQVTLVEPDDESVDPNPILNVTVDGNSPINVSISDSTAAFEKSFSNIAPGSTVLVNTSKIDDFGEGPNEYWNVSLESYGAKWNNSNDFYNFTVANINGIDYTLQGMSSGDNLNPGDFGGMNVYGQKEITFQVSSNPSGATDMNFRINISNDTDEEMTNFGSVDDGDTISVNLPNIGIINENSDNYSAEAYYLEGSSRVGPGYESDSINFSTHVAEVEFTHPGDNVDEFRVLYNATSNSSYSRVASIPIGEVTSDSNDLYEVGIANSGLNSNGDRDCYQVESWNTFGSELSKVQNSNDQCLGGSNP